MQRRWFVGLTVACLLLVAGAAVPVLGAGSAIASTGSTTDTVDTEVNDPAQQDAADPPQLGTPDGFNSTVFEVVIYENSSARWTVQHRRPLDTDQQRQQFETFAAEFNSTETTTYQDFKSRARALTDFSGGATGRQMNATDFRKTAEVREQFRTLGVMELSFMWTNFSRATDRGVVVDDVFEGGMYVNRGQRLVMVRESGLVFEAVEPDPDRMDVAGNLTASQSVTWFGEADFDDQRPKLVAVEPGTVGQRTGANDSESPAAGQLGPLPIIVALVFLLVLGGAIAWYSGGLEGLFAGGDDDSGGAVAESPETETADEETASAEPAVPEEELLSDEDRVLKLLDENGGRMKQVNIVDETEWSKSKVSMLLSDMEEEGLISKLRVGRENIISKAGEEPDAVGSPFDDE